MDLREIFATTAEAIRQKTGRTEKIKPSNFAAEIETITGGGSADTSDATATSAEILSGKTAYIASGKVTGTMPDNGTIEDTFDGIETKTYNIPEGYTSGGTIGLDDTIDNEVDEQLALINELTYKIASLPVRGEGDPESSDPFKLVQAYTAFNGFIDTQYGFQLDDEGYYKNTNSSRTDTTAKHRLEFNVVTLCDIVFDVYVGGYSGQFWMYQLDTTIAENKTYAGSGGGISVTNHFTIRYKNVQPGKHFIEMSYYRYSSTGGSVTPHARFKLLDNYGLPLATLSKAQSVEETLIPNNIRADTRIFGVIGTMETPESFDKYLEGKVSSYTNNRISYIAPYRFAGDTQLSSIICNSLTRVGSSAFFSCRSLSIIDFPACVSIDTGGFASCDRSRTVNLPQCVSVGYGAFSSNTNLTVSLPICQVVGAYGFCNCGISSIYLPQCTTLGTSAFAFGRFLSDVNLPMCSTVGAGAFYSCSKLVSITLPNCTSVDAGAFSYCSSLQEVNLPSCLRIYSNAFYSCSKLIDVNIPNCSMIGSAVFYSCSALSSISAPACLSIYPNAFTYCRSLINVDLPICHTISNYGFASCYALESIALPQCLSIGTCAFQLCSNLQQVSLPQCASVAGNAFQSCSKLQSITIPWCSSISPYAFAYCSSLQTVSFPVCTRLDYCAFYYCRQLPSISIPNVCSIGNSAFYYCTSLSTAEFGIELSQSNLSSAPYIGGSAFYSCSKLSQVKLYWPSVATLGNTSAFSYTPIYRSSYISAWGSIYVPASLVSAYQNATNWITFSSRITALPDEEV